MKFVDQTETPSKVVEIGQSGSWETSGAAIIKYKFDEHLKLTTDNYFGRETIDELISFLEFAKTKLQK